MSRTLDTINRRSPVQPRDAGCFQPLDKTETRPCLPLRTDSRTRGGDRGQLSGHAVLLDDPETVVRLYDDFDVWDNVFDGRRHDEACRELADRLVGLCRHLHDIRAVVVGAL